MDDETTKSNSSNNTCETSNQTSQENTQIDQNNKGNNNTDNNKLVDTKQQQQQQQQANGMKNGSSLAEDGKYWQARYEKLLDDYNNLQKLNQTLEDKLLNVVESFEKKKEELMATNEYEKSTLMADVNKLSTKLVDARIKLHDYEEKEMIHASECNSPCHKDCNSPLGLYKSTATTTTTTITNPVGCTPPPTINQQAQMDYDPNLV